MRPLNPQSAPPLPRRRKRPIAVRGNLSWRSRLRAFARQWRWVGWLAGLIVLGIVGWYGSRHQWLASLSKTVDAVAWIAADPSYLAEILIAIFIVVVSLLVWLPKRQAARSQGASAENYFDRENEARKTLAQIIAGVFVLAGLYSSVNTFELQRESQITDRFARALSQLDALAPGDEFDQDGKRKINLEERLGGIYSLEKIAHESLKDHWTIMEVATMYVRENAPSKDLTDEDLSAALIKKPPVRSDIQAILMMVGRRDARRDPPDRKIDLHDSDLHGMDIHGADFHRADFTGAHLVEAYLDKANFSGAILLSARLDLANFESANLSGANLTAAHLNNADFRDSDLTGANLYAASLKGANLEGTKLYEADLSGADFTGVYTLTQDQLNGTFGDADTKLPYGLTRPASWSK